MAAPGVFDQRSRVQYSTLVSSRLYYHYKSASLGNKLERMVFEGGEQFATSIMVNSRSKDKR